MTSSEKSFVTLVASVYLLLTRSCVVTSDKTLVLEAEGGATTGEVKRRESASNGASIYLNNGEYVSYGFNTTEECSIVTLNVRYSEGSTVDTATISIDGQDIGSFRTTVRSNGPDPWNEFYDSGQIGDEATLAAGEHTLRVSVSTTDEYGMEVDYIQLRTTCDITPYANEDATGADTTTQDSTYGGATATPAGSDSVDVITQVTTEQSEGTEHSSLSVLEILGIVGALLTAIGIVVAIVAVVVPIVALVLKQKNKRHSQGYTRA